MNPDPRHQDGCATWHGHLLAGIIASYEQCIYIEIGVLNGECWRLAAPHAAEAHGVDVQDCEPVMAGIGRFWHLPSDDFFTAYDGAPPDVIFVDGEHVKPWCERDARNALELIAPYGTVVLHDSQPTKGPGMRRHEELCGQVWEVRERLERDATLECFTFQRFPGVTLVRKR